MTKHRPLPPLERLQELFTLDTNGRLWWKAKPSPFANIRVGDEADGLCDQGYKTVKIDNVRFRVHRIVWALSNCADPGEKQIDHINRIRTDNRPENLRLATPMQNSENAMRRPRSSLGELCISDIGGNNRYRVRVRNRHIGVYPTIDEAVKARDEALEAARSEYSCW